MNDMAKGTLQTEYEKLVMDNLDLKERNKELENKIEDWENAEKFVLGTDCPTDEIHCGCVVVLKHRIKELKKLCDDLQAENIKKLLPTKKQIWAYSLVEGMGASMTQAGKIMGGISRQAVQGHIAKFNEKCQPP